MARLLMKMSLTLWWRGIKGNVGRMIGLGIGLLYGLGLAGTVSFFLLSAAASRQASTDLAVVLVSACITFAWLFTSLTAFNPETPLETKRFSLLGVRAKELCVGMLAARLVSLGGILTALMTLVLTATGLLWLFTASGAAGTGLWLAAAGMVAAAPLTMLTCFLLLNTLISVMDRLVTSKKAQSLLGTVVFFVIFCAVFAFNAVLQTDSDTLFNVVFNLNTLYSLTTFLSFTPLAAAYGAPVTIAGGNLILGLTQYAILAASLVLLWAICVTQTRGILEEPLRVANRRGRSKKNQERPFLLPLVPATPFGAVLTRSLRYWVRDTRYSVALLITLVMVGFMLVMAWLNPKASAGLIGAVVVMMSMSSGSTMNDFGADGPSCWVNITSGVSARDNVLGRIVANILVILPLMLLTTIVMPLVLGFGQYVPIFLGLGAYLLVSNSGFAMVLAVLLPFPMPAPGVNPMRQKNNSGTAFFSTLLIMFGIWLPLVPSAALAIWHLAGGPAWALYLAIALALVICALVFTLSVRFAIRKLDQNYVDIFAKVQHYA
ncbi:hypothetical protein ACUIAC_05165 [Dermabacteraceae bacterium P13138]